MTDAVTGLQIDEKDDGVVWVTIDRPQARNALSGVVLSGLEQVADTLGARADVRVVVFTGAGEKAFCAGADLKERHGMDEQQTRDRVDLIGRAFSKIARMPKPTIALLNGSAYGGGVELCIACDFRVAVEGIELGLTEVRLGIMPGAGGTQRLPRLIGASRAKEMIMLGRRVKAADALKSGLLHQVVPRAESVAAVDRLVAELLGCAPVSVASAKQAIDAGLDLGLDAGLKMERTCYDVTVRTEDRNEGLRAFAEKRPPNYQGK